MASFEYEYIEDFVKNPRFRFKPESDPTFSTTSKKRNADDDEEISVFALDCEMVRTRKRQELARVSLVNEDEEVVVDMFVKPRSKVIDYQTKYSGITAQLLDGCNNDLGTATKTIRQFVKAKDVLVGHDILNDLKALRLNHINCIDTSKIFPHTNLNVGDTPSLKSLASKYLKRQIQSASSGHDSVEDARTCIQLLNWRLEFERRISKGIYKNVEEAKEAVLLAAKIEPGLNLTNPAQFRRLLETLKVKLSWETSIYNWASERLVGHGSDDFFNKELERAKRGRGHDSVTRHSEIEDAKSAIRAYRGGKPKYEDSFFNWCKNNLRIDEEIISELWQWYHETELIEDEDDDISYEQDKNINSNQYRSIDEVKMALIAKAHSGVPRTKASFSNYLKCSMPKKVSKEWNHQLWNWAKKRYEL